MMHTILLAIALGIPAGLLSIVYTHGDELIAKEQKKLEEAWKELEDTLCTL
jgi:hypothetical protein